MQQKPLDPGWLEFYNKFRATILIDHLLTQKKGLGA